MRRRLVAVLAMLTACGINPAYDEASSSQASTQSTSSTSTTAASPTTTDPTTTTTATTGGLEATAGESTSTTTDVSTSTTSDASTSSDPSTTGAPAADCPAEDPSLIACYAFEEDPRSGAMLDGSVHGFHGSRAGAGAVASVEGFGAAVDLSMGSDVHVVYHQEFAPAQLTLAAFIYVDQDQVDRGFVDRAGSYGLYLTDGRVQCRVKTQFATAQIEVDIDINRWYHFACTYDGVRVRLHGHGLRFKPSPVEALILGEVNDSPSEFIIGRVAGDDNTKLHGAVDQVMVFDRALDPQQICDLAGPLCD